MSRRGAASLLLVLSTAPGVAAGDELAPVDDDGDDAEEVDGSVPDSDESDEDEPRLITAADRADAGEPPDDPVYKDHHRQLGIGLQIPVGVRAIVPYDGEYCGDRGENENVNAEVCVGRTPATLDFVLAYGLRPNVEVLLELRVGIERDFGQTANMDDGPRLFHWSPGVKVYFSDAGTTKLFTTAQLAFDHTGYDGEAGTDVFLRNVNGLEWDLHPSYGLYVFVGEELAFRRWFWIGVEAGIGIQGRYP